MRKKGARDTGDKGAKRECSQLHAHKINTHCLGRDLIGVDGDHCPAHTDISKPPSDQGRRHGERQCVAAADKPGEQQAGDLARATERLQRADTGVPFGRWRTLLRLQAALPALAAAEPVGHIARRVGYDTHSAFVTAFRRETGLTPSAYFHDLSCG